MRLARRAPTAGDLRPSTSIQTRSAGVRSALLTSVGVHSTRRSPRPAGDVAAVAVHVTPRPQLLADRNHLPRRCRASGESIRSVRIRRRRLCRDRDEPSRRWFGLPRRLGLPLGSGAAGRFMPFAQDVGLVLPHLVHEGDPDRHALGLAVVVPDGAERHILELLEQGSRCVKSPATSAARSLALGSSRASSSDFSIRARTITQAATLLMLASKKSSRCAPGRIAAADELLADGAQLVGQGHDVVRVQRTPRLTWSRISSGSRAPRRSVAIDSGRW